MVKHEIPVETCPVSNVKTSVIGSLEAHPIRRYFDRGLLVTVNTDDPDVRVNRLKLLNQIRSSLDAVADFSKIEG